MINVGIIGTGFGAKVHLPAWISIKGVTIRGIAGNDFKKTKIIAARYGVQPYKSWRALVRDPAVKIISIATPPFWHQSIIRAAAKAGKSILCEKPFCLDLSQAKNALRLATQSKIIHGVDFEFRYIPHFGYLRDLLRRQTIGQIRSVSVSWVTGGQAAARSPLRWIHKKNRGGGVLTNYGSHVIDYLEWMIGPITSALGQLAIAKPQAGRDTDDTCSILLTIKKTVPVSLIITNVVHGGTGHAITIYGSLGTLRLSNPNVLDPVKGFFLTHCPAGAASFKRLAVPLKYGTVTNAAPDGRLVPFQVLIKNFLKAYQKKRSDVPTFADGVRSQAVIDTLKKSHRLKKWVTVLPL